MSAKGCVDEVGQGAVVGLALQGVFGFVVADGSLAGLDEPTAAGAAQTPPTDLVLAAVRPVKLLADGLVKK